jgi:hypothetical protein
MTVLQPDAILVRNERLAWRVLEGGAVILFPEAGSLHRLNSTGTRIWEHLDGRRTIGDIAVAMADEYNVELDEAVEHVCQLAADLVEANLAQLVAKVAA